MKTSLGFLVTVLMAGTGALGQSWTQTGGASPYYWSEGANWSGGTVPAVGGGSGLQISFGTLAGGMNLTSINDRGSGGVFNLNRLTLGGTAPAGGASITVQGDTLNFNGANRIIDLNGYSSGANVLSYAIANPITLNTGALVFQGAGNGSFTLGGGISGTHAIQFSNTDALLTLRGPLSQQGILYCGSLNGRVSQALVLSGVNTFTNRTEIRDGLLILDYTVQNNSKLSTTALLDIGSTYGGGNPGLEIVGHAGTPFTQTLGGLNLRDYGYHTLALRSGQTSLDVGAVTRGYFWGPLLRLVNGSGGAIRASGGAANTLLKSANGVAYAVYNGDWAAFGADGATLGRGADIPGFYTSDTWGAGNNTDVLADQTVPAAATTGSLRFNSAAGRTLTLSGNATVTAGILVTEAVGANDAAITGGTLYPGGGGREIVVFQHNTAGVLRVASDFGDYGGNSARFSKAGAGRMIFTGTMLGTAYREIALHEGTLQWGAGALAGPVTQPGVRMGTAATLSVDGGSGFVFQAPVSVARNSVLDVAAGSRINATGIAGNGEVGNWIKTGPGELSVGPNAGFMHGWVKGGVCFIATSGNNYAINSGAVCGDVADGAPAAAIDFLGWPGTRLQQFGNGLTLNRTGTLYLRGFIQEFTPTFVGGGAIIAGGGTNSSASIAYNTGVTNATATIAGGVMQSGSRNDRLCINFTIADAPALETEMRVDSDLRCTTAVGGVTKAGAGTLELNGASLFPGGIAASAGVLRLGALAAVPAASDILISSGGYAGAGFAATQTGFIDRMNKASSQGVIGFDADTAANVSLTGFHSNARLGSSTAATLSGSITPQSTIFRLGGGGGTLTIESVLANNGAATQIDMGTSGALRPGTVVLNGNNTITSYATINAGELRVNGSLATASYVDVKAGATLSGTGAVSRTIVRAGSTTPGGRVAPGDTAIVGTLNTGAFELYPGATTNAAPVWRLKLGDETNDRIASGGDFTMAATGRVVLRLTNAGDCVPNGRTFVLMTWTGSDPAGDGTQFDLDLAATDWTGGTVTVDKAVNEIRLSGVRAPVPEGTLILLR